MTVFSPIMYTIKFLSDYRNSVVGIKLMNTELKERHTKETDLWGWNLRCNTYSVIIPLNRACHYFKMLIMNHCSDIFLTGQISRWTFVVYHFLKVLRA